jgi:hypothetical protein
MRVIAKKSCRVMLNLLMKGERPLGLHGSAKMENPMKASTATATTLIAIATSSMVEYRLGSKLNGMHHFLVAVERQR